MNDKPKQRQQLRQHFREERRRLGAAQQHRAALALALRIAKQPFYQRAHSIAAYLPNDGEISPLPLLHAAARCAKRVYLPLLAGQSLHFYRYRPGLTPLRCNRLGVLEPYPRKADFIAPERLELVLLPLVAFDVAGNRLGMGGGFYDRTFAFRGARHHSARPILVGISHQLQRAAEGLAVNPWDIPLDAIATDRTLYVASNGRRGLRPAPRGTAR